MHRREFLKWTGLGTLAFGARPTLLLSQDPQLSESLLKPVQGGIHVFTKRGGTIASLLTEEGYVIVDAQFPDTAKLLWDTLTDSRVAPLHWLVNTHHHRDHTAGNKFLKPLAAHSIAHKNVPVLQRAMAAKKGRLEDEAYVDQVFDKEFQFMSGEEIVHLKWHGNAHTIGDATVYFEKANVMHMGDLVFNRRGIVFDRDAGGSFRGWIEVLEKIHASLPNDVRLIFGHGSAKYGVVGTSSDLLVMRDFLQGIWDYASAGLKRGESVEHIAEAKVLPRFPEHYNAMREDDLPKTLKKVCAEIEEEGA